jgi:hypothetical protein
VGTTGFVAVGGKEVWVVLAVGPCGVVAGCIVTLAVAMAVAFWARVGVAVAFLACAGVAVARSVGVAVTTMIHGV